MVGCGMGSGRAHGSPALCNVADMPALLEVPLDEVWPFVEWAAHGARGVFSLGGKDDLGRLEVRFLEPLLLDGPYRVVAAGSAAVGTAAAQNAGERAILEPQRHATSLGQPVAATGYGMPSRHERNLMRRESPGLTRVSAASVSFSKRPTLCSSGGRLRTSICARISTPWRSAPWPTSCRCGRKTARS